MFFTKTEKHLGTDIEIQIVSDREDTQKIIDDLFLYCEDFEAEFSRFRPESQLSQLNKNKRGIVSERFLKLLKLSLQYMEETNGYFSPFVNVSALGYSQSFDTGVFIPTCTFDGKGICNYKIDGNTVTLGENTSFDFGGIGKGFLVDEIVSQLEEKGFSNFCINAGGDLVVRGKNQAGFPWGIGVENPQNGENCAVFYCENCAVNTSGGYRRKWKLENTEHHHIVNPLTGKNTNEYTSVTIVASSSAKADALTKVLWHTSPENLDIFFKTYGVNGLVIKIDSSFYLSKDMIELYSFRYI